MFDIHGKSRNYAVALVYMLADYTGCSLHMCQGLLKYKCCQVMQYSLSQLMHHGDCCLACCLHAAPACLYAGIGI